MFVRVRFVILAVLIIFLSSACSPPEQKKEEQIKYPLGSEVSPEHYFVIAENDYLRLVHVSWGPREKDEMHSHPPFAAYFLTDFDGRVHYPDGSTTRMSVKAGKAIVSSGEFGHAVENSANETAEMILVERKMEFPVEPLVDAAPLSHDMSPDVYRILAEDEHLRVVEAIWQPGQRDLFHSHPPFSAYLLTDVDGLLMFPNGRNSKVRFAAGKGMVQFADPSHSFENLSDKTIKMLIVEAK